MHDFVTTSETRFFLEWFNFEDFLKTNDCFC